MLGPTVEAAPRASLVSLSMPQAAAAPQHRVTAAPSALAPQQPRSLLGASRPAGPSSTLGPPQLQQQPGPLPLSSSISGAPRGGPLTVAVDDEFMPSTRPQQALPGYALMPQVCMCVCVSCVRVCVLGGRRGLPLGCAGSSFPVLLRTDVGSEWGGDWVRELRSAETPAIECLHQVCTIQTTC